MGFWPGVIREQIGRFWSERASSRRIRVLPTRGSGVLRDRSGIVYRRFSTVRSCSVWWRVCNGLVGACGVAGKAAISRPRSRLGAAALRRALWEEARPLGRGGPARVAFTEGPLDNSEINSGTSDVPNKPEFSPTFWKAEFQQSQLSSKSLVSWCECEPLTQFLLLRIGAYRMGRSAISGGVLGHIDQMSARPRCMFFALGRRPASATVCCDTAATRCCR